MSQFMNEDEVKQNVSVWILTKKLWSYIKKHKALASLCFLSVLVIAICSRMSPTIIGYAIDHGISAGNRTVIMQAAIAFLVFMSLETIFEFIQAYFFQKLGNRVLYYIREDLLKHAQHLPIQYFNQTPTGRIVTRLTNDPANLGDMFSEVLFQMVVSVSILISIAIAMLLISVKLALAVLIIAPPFIWFALKITVKIRDILRSSKKQLSVINSYVAENINGIKIVQLYNRVHKNREHFSSLSAVYREILMKSIRAYASLQPAMNIFNAITITIALYYGGFLSANDGLALGAVVAFILHTQDLIHPLREILEKYQLLQNSITSAERVLHLLEEPKEQTQIDNVVPDVHGEIKISNLNFRYRDDLPLVLKNINLQIHKGQKIAVVGRTGSGKSTLISLLQKFYDAPSDSIFIDGVDISLWNRQHLRSLVGVVQQDNFIFRGTIKDNVSLADQKISDSSIANSLEKVGYTSLLKRNGRTLNSAVEERGANLSAGERQLIAFARILAFKPEILILDEATANIDSESEKIIQTATNEITKGRTSIIIAHRLSTIKDCDKIIYLHDGEIKEIGSHDELMNKKGYYYQVASSGESLISE